MGNVVELLGVCSLWKRNHTGGLPQDRYPLQSEAKVKDVCNYLTELGCQAVVKVGNSKRSGCGKGALELSWDKGNIVDVPGSIGACRGGWAGNELWWMGGGCRVTRVEEQVRSVSPTPHRSLCSIQ